MKLNSITNRYILKELITPFVMSLTFFMFVFLMRQILDITNMIVNYQVSVVAFLLMLFYSMPYFLVYVIPMSSMMSVLLTTLRMSNDNEIVALKAGGVSLYSLLPPVCLFAVFTFFLTMGMAIYGLPWGTMSYQQIALKVVRSNFNIGLKENRFNDSFNGVMFYVKRIDFKTRKLIDVFIEDSREKGISSTVVAPGGIFLGGGESGSLVLRLDDGLINQVDIKNRSANTIRFKTYDIRLDLKQALSDFKKRAKDENEMQLSELIDYIRSDKKENKRYLSILMTLHRKFSIPFACLALSLLAVPLGIQTESARRSAGLSIGLISFLMYYLLLSAGTLLTEARIFPPAVGMWTPDLIMGGLGIYLYVRVANDHPIVLFSKLRYIVIASVHHIIRMVRRRPSSNDPRV